MSTADSASADFIPPRARGFTAHLIACAVGAGIDNVVRQVVSVALAATAATTAAAENYANWAVMLFILPFIFLAPTAGSLGDRIGKHRIVRWARLADVPICALAVLGFAVHSVPIMLAGVALLGCASAFFAPVKLAIVPELVPSAGLEQANARLNAVSVVAILAGACLAAATDAAVAGWLGQTFGLSLPMHAITTAIMAVLCAVICVSGVIAAFRLPTLVAQNPRAPVVGPWGIGKQIRSIGSAPGLWAPALGLSGFWILGTVASIGMVPIAAKVYQLGQAGTAAMLLLLVVGVAIGSLSAPRLMARAFPAGLPIAGALFSGLGFIAAGWIAHQHHLTVEAGVEAGHALPAHAWLWFAGMLTLCGIGTGWWEVPLVVLMQERAPAAQRNLILSGVSALTCVGILFAGIGMLALGALGWDNPVKFMAIGIAVVGLALACGYAYRIQLTGWLIALIGRLTWRITATGREHVPATGGCLLVCNHLSFGDWLPLLATLPRQPRFMVFAGFFRVPVVGFFLRAAGAVPVDGGGGRQALLASITATVNAAKGGEIVVVFPEGKLSRCGTTDSFRSGMERIASRAGVPVIPVHIHGLYGTWFSKAPRIWARRAGWPMLRRRVDLRFGAPLPSDTSAGVARDQVMALSHQHALAQARRRNDTLDRAFLRQAWKRPFAITVQDAGGKMRAWQVAAAARRLLPLLQLAKDETCVGVVLPPGRGGTVVNVALAMAGRTAVNLNHTAGAAQLARMCELAGVRTVISAGLYLRKIGNPTLAGRVVMVEELLPKLSKIGLVLTAFGHWLLPWLGRVSRPDDVAAIVFSSGSTGDPKGVALTHRQVLANAAVTMRGLDLHGGDDVVLSPLPLFHSFGLIPGLWLGLTHGMTVAAQPDPTDGKALGDLAQATGASFLISTATFVRGYLRRIEPEQLKRLRLCVVGAERCPAELKTQFKERFGADLLEGYGCTELAPTVAINLPTIDYAGEREVRSRDGSVGRALPGLHVFAVDPDSKAILPPNREGLLIVRSPSRMQGYLNRDDLTSAAFIHDGYNTGDIGKVDDDGFIFITGRLARFAKIAGEMVPLDNVESALQTAVGLDIEVAVAAISDSARGERLVILHTTFAGSWDAVLTTIEHLPPLWRPKARDAREVPAIPKLGTGKRDLAGLKRLAAELFTPS